VDTCRRSSCQQRFPFSFLRCSSPLHPTHTRHPWVGGAARRRGVRLWIFFKSSYRCGRDDRGGAIWPSLNGGSGNFFYRDLPELSEPITASCARRPVPEASTHDWGALWPRLRLATASPAIIFIVARSSGCRGISALRVET
jgi:hypothetical protein